MFKKLLNKIKINVPSANEHASRRRWVIPVAALAGVLILSGVALYATGAAVKTHSFWSESDKPKVINQHDSHPVELGLKFRTKTSGQVTGVKFYKSRQNVGTHIGNLWDKRGKKLATVTFKNETQSGWQTAKFDKPVTINPDTTYIVSYFAPKGHFSIDSRYFAHSARTSGPLTALKSGTDGVNSVYSYGFRSSFPSDDSNKDNYWVDVIFTSSEVNPIAETPKSIKAFDSANIITDPVWFKKAYDSGLRLYIANVTDWGTCNQSAQAKTQIKAALDAGLKVAAYTRDPGCWENGIKAAGEYKTKLQFFALDVELSGKPATREMVNGIKAQGIRPIAYTSKTSWTGVQGNTVNSFTDIPLWDVSTSNISFANWTPNYMSPAPVAYGGWNVKGNMRVGVQQQFDYLLNGISINLNSFDQTYIIDSPTKPIDPVTPTPPTTPTTPTAPTTPVKGRAYPLHTRIIATTFWVGEQFQATDDGSQICSAYDGAWQFSHFGVKAGETVSKNCNNPYPTKCDAVKINANGPCSAGNVSGSIYLPQNDYRAVGGPISIENPFYLDLPYNDYGTNGEGGYITGSATRCQDIPWANDPGYIGKCTAEFSYMKNRWVQVKGPSGTLCYGQIQDAGPADIGNGNPNYADRTYVFGVNDTRPFNKSYNGAGMDVSPALGACVGGKFNQDVTVDWRFVDDVDVPDGPWKRIVTKSGVNW